ncbi:MAG TPA: hypothetical protein VGF97_01620 [Rhizomicrobium sp.]
MHLRTFIAGDMRAALASVRAEMGAEAVIVASERAKGGGVLVRAACEGAHEHPGSDRIEQDAGTRSGDDRSPAERDRVTHAFELRYREGLLQRLRGEPRGRATTCFNRAELLGALRAHRAREQCAHQLAAAVDNTGLSDMTLALASGLDQRMRTAPLDFAGTGALLMMGPPGAGKTAVAAKIAAHALQLERRVVLIAGDASGAGAVSRLETFANHLGAQFVVSESAPALARHVEAANAEDMLAIIDTAGFDPRQAKTAAAFAALGRIENVEPLAIVSATLDAEEMAEIVAALVALGARRAIVTGLDLVKRSGALLAAALHAAELAHVTRSPFVSGGLETLTPLSLARLLVKSEACGRESMSAA